MEQKLKYVLNIVICLSGVCCAAEVWHGLYFEEVPFI